MKTNEKIKSEKEFNKIVTGLQRKLFRADVEKISREFFNENDFNKAERTQIRLMVEDKIRAYFSGNYLTFHNQSYYTAARKMFKLISLFPEDPNVIITVIRPFVKPYKLNINETIFVSYLVGQRVSWEIVKGELN